MKDNFLQVSGQHFSVQGEEVILRGFSLGNWLNIEHFMIGLPGTEGGLRKVLKDVYGKENAAKFWDKYRECYVSEDDFRFLKDMGTNVVRIPFNYRLFESDQAPYEYHKEGFRHLDRALALCEKYQIYAILDLHTAPGGQNPDWHSDNLIGETQLWNYADFKKRVGALWRYVAKHYRNNPWVGGYDLINEPCIEKTREEELEEFYNYLIKEIRTVDHKHILFVEGNAYARDFTFLKPIKDANVAYSFHYYPHHMLAELNLGNRMAKLEAGILGDSSLEEFRRRLGRPLWCGETGVSTALADPKERIGLYEDILTLLEKFGISYTMWTYKDAGSMSAVFPKPDSSWTKLSRKICENWDLRRDFIDGPGIAEERMKQLSGDVSEGLKKRFMFRLLAERQFLLSEKCAQVLKETPFEDLMSYVESFRFGECDIWEDAIEALKKYTESKK